MPLAERLHKLRTEKDLSLDVLAEKAGVSKTYLWELERDTKGEIKPSAEVLLRIANALSTTLADLLELATVTIRDAPVQIPPALREFQERMAAQKSPLSDADLRDLASMKFRGGQPQTADQWHQLYLVLANSSRRRKP